MKVKAVVFTDNDPYDIINGYTIFVDGEKKASFFEGEPEDATLGRNYSDVYNIPELMRMAHEAGLKNEPLEFEDAETSDWDDV